MLRDGKDFCCPKKQCDKVYPSRENLRQHIAAHYHSGATAPLPGFTFSLRFKNERYIIFFRLLRNYTIAWIHYASSLPKSKSLHFFSLDFYDII